jgi:hypothetical protein
MTLWPKGGGGIWDDNTKSLVLKIVAMGYWVPKKYQILRDVIY